MFLGFAFRNIWRNKRRTIITALSVFFAVILGIFMQSASYGSLERMLDNMLKFQSGYLQVQAHDFKNQPSLDNNFEWSEDFLAKLSKSVDTANFQFLPKIQTVALAGSEENTRVVQVVGTQPQAEDKANQLSSYLVSGSFLEEGEHAVLIGRSLAERLNMKVGDTMVVFGQGFMGVNAAALLPIKGILDHHIREINETYLCMPLSVADEVFGMYGHITNLIINPLRTSANMFQVRESLKAELDESIFQVYHWEELNSNFVSMMEFDRITDQIMIWILYLVVAFGIFGTVLTMTLERNREFGILISIGMHPKKLMLVLAIESVCIAFLGVVFGLLVGWPMAYLLKANPIPLSGELGEMMMAYGFEPILPFSTNPMIFLNQGLTVFVITMLIVLYPIWHIWRLDFLAASRR